MHYKCSDIFHNTVGTVCKQERFTVAVNNVHVGFKYPLDIQYGGPCNRAVDIKAGDDKCLILSGVEGLCQQHGACSEDLPMDLSRPDALHEFSASKELATSP